MNVVFGLFSEEELLSISKIEVNKKYDVSDPKLGTGDNVYCSECSDPRCCLGHMGYLRLKNPIFNPLFIKNVLKIMEKICTKCSHLLNFDDKTKKSHFMCAYCHKTYPKIRSYKFAKSLKSSSKKNQKVTKLHCVVVGPYGFDQNSDVFNAKNVKEIFSGISIEDKKSLGFIQYSGPERFVMNLIPIIPNCVRTSLDSTDIITRRYERIVSIRNEHMRSTDKDDISTIKIFQEYSKLLGVEGVVGKTKGEIELESFKSMKQRLTGKTGLFRRYALGKRNENCGRAVISPDPNLNVDEVGIPKAFSKDMLIDCRTFGSTTETPENRNLENGDIIIINRQPSLQRHSLMSFKVKLTDLSVININPAVCPAFNADFDGDEMNVFCPGNYGSIAESKELLGVDKCIISPQNNQPVIYPIFDCVSGLYLLTNKNVSLDKQTFFQCLMTTDNPIHYAKGLQLAKNHEKLTGFLLISCLIPFPLEEETLTSKSLRWIIKIICEMDTDLALDFINSVQRVVNYWMLNIGFSIGYEDCLLNNKVENKTLHMIYDRYSRLLKDEDITEQEEYIEIENMRNEIVNLKGPLISYDDYENPLLVSINSGAKGNMINISQISCLLGQQYIDGKRPSKTPYIEDDLLKSYGFCKNSFIDGLSPLEYFFHCQAGREGVINTGMNTPRTGYLQRRMGRFLEDVVVNADLTIRNGKKIIRF